MIPFNAPPVVGTELDYMQSAMGSGKLCGDGGFTRRCQQWMEQRFRSAKVLLTPSCTASLEMAALLLDIQPVAIILSAWITLGLVFALSAASDVKGAGFIRPVPSSPGLFFSCSFRGYPHESAGKGGTTNHTKKTRMGAGFFS